MSLIKTIYAQFLVTLPCELLGFRVLTQSSSLLLNTTLRSNSNCQISIANSKFERQLCKSGGPPL